MENQLSMLINAFIKQGYSTFLVGNAYSGFYLGNELLANACFERHFVCDPFTDELLVVAKVTSACGTILGIAIY